MAVKTIADKLDPPVLRCRKCADRSEIVVRESGRLIVAGEDVTEKFEPPESWASTSLLGLGGYRIDRFEIPWCRHVIRRARRPGGVFWYVEA